MLKSPQNQLLTKGMVILRDKIRFYEGMAEPVPPKGGLGIIFSLHFLTLAGQKLLDSLAETWDFFFCDVLSMLQAIFHPVQVDGQQRSPLIRSLSITLSSAHS